MKVLIVSSQENNSGAGRAAYRLCKALEEEGVDVKILVRSQITNDWRIIGPQTRLDKILSLILPFLDLAIFAIFNRKRKGVFSSSLIGSRFVWKKLKKYDADIIHLHWVNAGTFNLSDLKKIKKPIVWTLHDEWLYTGACHVANGCIRYKEICHACPELKSKYKYDLSYWLHKRKKWVFENNKIMSLTIIGLSNWILERARQSTMLNNFPIIQLPNCIDTNLYKPINKSFAKDFFNFSLDKKVILFGAVNAMSDVNKGFDLLSEALDGFKDNSDFIYVVLGSSKRLDSIAGNKNIRLIPHKHDDETLVLLYNASDVVIVPSKQENLSNMIMESLSCGTPVVAFDTGGNSDLIVHKSNGYLAKPFDADDLRNGVKFILENENLKSLNLSARTTIEKKFSNSVVAKKYLELYEKIINQPLC
jgi:glycosyltransferase involved in cell wall biosynthesis